MYYTLTGNCPVRTEPSTQAPLVCILREGCCVRAKEERQLKGSFVWVHCTLGWLIASPSLLKAISHDEAVFKWQEEDDTLQQCLCLTLRVLLQQSASLIAMRRKVKQCSRFIHSFLRQTGWDETSEQKEGLK